MSGCRLFHACGSACAKAGSLNDVVVRGMMRSPTAADRKRRLGSGSCKPECRVPSNSLVHSREKGKGRAAGRGRVRLFVCNRGSGRVNVLPGRVGSTFCRVGLGRVQEKWPVDNSDSQLASIVINVSEIHILSYPREIVLWWITKFALLHNTSAKKYNKRLWNNVTIEFNVFSDV